MTEHFANSHSTFSLSLCQNFNYTLDKWSIESADFPGYIPQTRFEGYAEVLMRQRKLGSITFFGQIKRI